MHFPDTHPEILRATELGLPVIRYHRFLGDFLKNFTSVAVTGAHGKTSTTGLLAHVMGGAKPTSYLIGDGTGKGTEMRIISYLRRVNIVVISFLIIRIMQS